MCHKTDYPIHDFNRSYHRQCAYHMDEEFVQSQQEPLPSTEYFSADIWRFSWYIDHLTTRVTHKPNGRKGTRAIAVSVLSYISLALRQRWIRNIYLAEVGVTDWKTSFPDTAMPAEVAVARCVQKLERV